MFLRCCQTADVRPPAVPNLAYSPRFLVRADTQRHPHTLPYVSLRREGGLCTRYKNHYCDLLLLNPADMNVAKRAGVRQRKETKAKHFENAIEAVNSLWGLHADCQFWHF